MPMTVSKIWKHNRITGVWRLTLEENRLPDVGADGGHGVQVGETFLVLLGDGQQGAHIPDLMIDVVPSGFGRSFGRSERDHSHWGQGLEDNWRELKPRRQSCLQPQTKEKEKKTCLELTLLYTSVGKKELKGVIALNGSSFFLHNSARYLFLEGSYGNCWYERLPCLRQTRGLSVDCVIKICLGPSTESLGLL